MSRVVLCNGVFDVYHVGHLLHFQAAKLLGDTLIVSITRDEFVNKGPLRPVFGEELRKLVISQVKCVDGAILVNSSLDALKLVKPQVFVKGAEYRGKILAPDREFCQAWGIEIAYTNEPQWSSTKLLHFYAGKKRREPVRS